MGLLVVSRKITLVFLSVFLLLFLTACYTDIGYIPEGSKEKEEYSGRKAVVTAMEVADKGYYYIINDILYFYDIANDISIPMCSRVDCKHGGQNCDAYAATNYRGKDISCVCEGGSLFYRNDQLYMVERDRELNYYLCRYDSSFNNRKVMAQLSSFSEESTQIAPNHSYALHDGYFYYYTFVLDIQFSETGTIYDYSCMRVALKEGAIPEKLGEFKFPSDYGYVLGSSLGMTVLACGRDIYYMAGDSVRWWSKEDPMQYRVARYSLETGEFSVLESYTGEVDSNAWGENLGVIRCEGTRMCIAEDGTIYALAQDGVAALNYDKNIKKRIYDSPYKAKYDEVHDLAFDGTYLYFFEEDDLKAIYLTVIDTEGNLVRRHAFEYTDAYKTNRDGTIRSNFVSKGLVLHGLDNRYIMILASNISCNAFKGLSTEKKLTQQEEEKNPSYGVGIIRTSDFLSGKDIEIKQIYKYQ